MSQNNGHELPNTVEIENEKIEKKVGTENIDLTVFAPHMTPGVVYNVRRIADNHVLLSRDDDILIDSSPARGWPW